MTEIETNLRLLEASRAKVRKGDAFAMLLPDDLYLFGRVILADLPRERVPGANLIYIYRPRSPAKEPDRTTLDPQSLLIPPLYINQLPWSKGYFETVGHWPVEPQDVRSQHCFLSAARGVYLNEKGEELPGPIEPVGDWGLHSYRTVDDEISDALEFDRAPE
jgi:hypothetical protein